MNLIKRLYTLWQLSNSTPQPQPREKTYHARRYDGARYSRTESDWVASSTSADSEIYTSLCRLRNRSRDLIRNNDYARGAIRAIANNVLGTGICFQAQVKRQRGEGNNDTANDSIESAWKYWSKKQHCDVSGKLSFKALQNLVLRSVIESGEVFVRKIYSNFGGCKIPFALEVIEADQVPDDYNDTYNGNQIKMGVEIDKWNRPVAYWVYQYHPGDYNFSSVSARTNNKLQRIPVEDIIHLYVQERPGQTRGVPWFYSPLVRLRHLGKYEEAELVAARASANIMGIVQTPDADILGEPTLDEDGEEVKPEEALEPGIIKYLSSGETFQGFDPSRPNTAFDPFVRMMLRGISAGIGMSYESLSKDYSQSNYSSSRLSLLEDKDNWKILQEWFIDNFLDPVYSSWLDYAVLSGALNFSDYELNPYRYQEIRWTPRGWSWVDPYKEINATIAAIDAGLTTLTQEIAKQGGDVEETFKIRAKEIELAKELNIPLKLETYQITELDDNSIVKKYQFVSNGNGKH